jgi:hypothetical protein
LIGEEIEAVHANSLGNDDFDTSSSSGNLSTFHDRAAPNEWSSFNPTVTEEANGNKN